MARHKHCLLLLYPIWYNTGKQCTCNTNAKNHPFRFHGTDGFLLVEVLPQAPVNAVFQTAAARFFESLMEKYRVGKPVQHLKKSVAFLIVMLI